MTVSYEFLFLRNTLSLILCSCISSRQITYVWLTHYTFFLSCSTREKSNILGHSGERHLSPVCANATGEQAYSVPTNKMSFLYILSPKLYISLRDAETASSPVQVKICLNKIYHPFTVQRLYLHFNRFLP